MFRAEQTSTLERGSSRQPATALPAIIALLIFSTLSILCAIRSEGFVADDACTHYLYAKYAFSDPINLVDVWARPFCTLLFAIPAKLGGRLAVRITSLLVALGCGAVAWRIAKGQGLRWPVLALLFTLGQPLLFVYSFGEMTELPFALLLGAAFLAYQERRWFAAALLVGLTPTARPEGFGFVALAVAALMLQRQWKALPFLPLPLLAWDIAGWVLTGRQGHWWRWLADAWPWSAEGMYGRGNILSFVAVLPVIVSPLVLPATMIGTWLSLRERIEPERIDRHKQFCRILSAAIPLSILLGHSVLRWLGKMGSFGEPRYLLIAAPFWGVLSARGWEWAFSRLQWPRPFAWAAAAALLPVAVNLVQPAVPVHLDRQWQTARRFADWYRGSGQQGAYSNVVASHPGVFYYLDQDPTGTARRGGFTRGIIQSVPRGTILVWDPVLSPRNANADDAATLETIRKFGWLPDPQANRAINLNGADPAPDSARNWHVFHSPEPCASGPVSILP